MAKLLSVLLFLALTAFVTANQEEGFYILDLGDVLGISVPDEEPGVFTIKVNALDDAVKLKLKLDQGIKVKLRATL